jgi:tetratricopeptide (TPR) repeat protein
MKRRINRRFLVGLLVLLAVLAVGIHFLHAFQSKRNAQTLLRRADYAEKKGKSGEVLTCLRHYLAIEPDKADVRARYGFALEKQAGKTHSSKMLWNAYLTFEAALRANPEQTDVRRHQADFAMKLGRYDDARKHLEFLLEKSPKDAAVLEEKLGACAEALRDYKKAAEKYQAAVKHAPHKLETYGKLASLFLQQLKDPQQAELLMKQMVDDNQKDAQAWLLRARYRMKVGTGEESLTGAAKDLKVAGRLAPKNAGVLLTSAELAQKQGKPAEARRLLERALYLHPQKSDPYLALVRLEIARKKPKAALRVIGRGLEKLPEREDLREPRGDLLLIRGDLLLDQGKITEARKDLVQLQNLKYDAPLVAILEARILLLEGKWPSAKKILEELGRQRERAKAVSGQLSVMLGLCHEQLGNFEEALAAYQQADKLSSVARSGAARALMNLGRFGEAAAECRIILGFPERPANTRVLLARALLEQNMQLPRRERGPNWRPIDEQLVQAASELKGMKEAVDVQILRANLIVLRDPTQDGQARAVALLKKAKPDEPRIWVALAHLEAWRHGPREALEVLRQAPGELAGQVELAIARATYLARLPRKDRAEARQGLKALEKAAAQLSRADRQQLLETLGTAYYAVGARAKATSVFQGLAREQPFNLSLRLVLFEIARADKNEAAKRGLLKELQALEGEAGVNWRYEKAVQLLDQTASTANGSPERERLLEEARRQLDEVTRRRPRWFRAAALEGAIDDLGGRTDQAIGNFQRAVELGDRRPGLIRRLVELLRQGRRYAEAEQAVRRLISQERELARLPGDFKKLAATSLLEGPQRDEVLALHLARDAVSSQSKDYRDLLWLGQLLQSIDKPEERKEAGGLLRRALDLAKEKDPGAWVAWVSYLTAEKRIDEAKAAVARAVQKLPTKDAPLTLAYCYEKIGQIGAAEKQLRTALTARPDDPTVVEFAARFYLTHNRSREAAAALRKLMDAPKAGKAEQRWARRNLARVLAQGVGRRNFEKALALIAENLKTASKTEKEQDLHVQALLLATRVKERQKAIQLYENLQSLSAAEQVTLAGLYEADGRWDRARTRLLTLLARPEGRKPVYVARYIGLLLDHDKLPPHNLLPEAEAQLANLERLEKDCPRTFETVAVRARVLHASGKHEDAVKLLRTYVEKQNANPGAVAMLLDSFVNTADAKDVYAKAAETMYRKYLEQKRTPTRLLLLAGFLGRQHNSGDALDCCEEALRKGAGADAIPVAVLVLRTAPAGPAQYRRVERWLDDAAAHRNTIGLQMARANLYDLQGDYAKAIAAYREVLRRDEHQVLASNNLAWLLALAKKKDLAQALEEIKRAIDFVGPSPELLDTRAVIYIQEEMYEEAALDLRECLRQSAAGSGTLATRYFHLAWALETGHPSEARKEFQRAKDAGLEESMLHPLERPSYQRLRDKFPSR